MTETKTMIEQLIRKRGLKIKDALEILSITRPTYLRYVNEPMYMNGYQRKQFANMLGIPSQYMDAICNGVVKYGSETFISLIEEIQSLKQKQNENS